MRQARPGTPQTTKTHSPSCDVLSGAVAGTAPSWVVGGDDEASSPSSLLLVRSLVAIKPAVSSPSVVLLERMDGSDIISVCGLRKAGQLYHPFPQANPSSPAVMLRISAGGAISYAERVRLRIAATAPVAAFFDARALRSSCSWDSLAALRFSFGPARAFLFPLACRIVEWYECVLDGQVRVKSGWWVGDSRVSRTVVGSPRTTPKQQPHPTHHYVL